MRRVGASRSQGLQYSSILRMILDDLHGSNKKSGDSALTFDFSRCLSSKGSSSPAEMPVVNTQRRQPRPQWRQMLLPYWLLLIFFFIVGISLFGAALLQGILQ